MDNGISQVPVCVVGGGPAGCIAAIQLARNGHSVTLVTRRAAAEEFRAEVISHGAALQLEALGLSEAIHKSQLGRPKVRTLLWDTPSPLRIETDGRLIERRAFDRALLDHVRSAGVAVREFEQSVLAWKDDDERWKLRASPKASPFLITDHLVDATGSGSSLIGARKRLSAPLVAICARARGSGYPPDEMFVESFANGWTWASSTAGGDIYISVFVDPGQLHGEAPAALIQRVASESGILPHWCGPVRPGHVSLRNAGSFENASVASPDYIAIGDAAVAGDPLLSGGIQRAVSSALKATVVIEASCESGKKFDLAVKFILDQHEAIRCRVLDNVCAQYFEASKKWKSPFWRDRQGAGPAVDRMTQSEKIAFRGDQSVVLSAAVRFETGIVIQGKKAEEIRVLSHPSLEQPIGFVCDVPVTRLLEDQDFPTRLSSLAADIAEKIGKLNSRKFLEKMLVCEIIITK